MKRALHLFIILFLFASFIQAQPEYSLHLNGINQLGSASLQMPVLDNGISVEAWINPENLDGNEARHTIVSTDQISGDSYQGFALRCGNGGDLSFKIGNGTAWIQVLTDNQPLQLNTWQHVAATYDQDTFHLYINGIPVEQKAATDEMVYSTLPIRVGKSILGPRWFEGRLDDVRVWNGIRSITDIQSNMCISVDTNDPNLIAYWKFDDDPDGMIATDESSNAFNLTINNITPSDWQTDDNCTNCNAPTNLTTGVPAATSSILSWYASGYNSWNIEYGLEGFAQGNGTLITNIDQIPYQINGLEPESNYDFYIQENCTDLGNSPWAGPVAFQTLLAGYCVEFDGATQVGEATQALPDFGTEITVEAWINADEFDGNISNHTIVSTDQEDAGNKEGFALRCGNGGDLSFVIGDGANWVQVLTTDQAMSTNNWYHVAATYDQDSFKLYINGNLVAGDNNNVVMMNSDLPVRIGKSILGPRWFDGRLDEIRIWDVARSAVDIQSFRCENLIGDEVGLVAYWNFDDGPFSTMLADNGPNNIDVAISNITAPDWKPDDNCLDCTNPSDLSIITYGANSVDLTWFSGGFNSWNIEYGPSSFTPGNGTLVGGIDSNPYQLQGLEPDVVYDIYLQENCGTVGTSDWIGPVSVTTLLAEYALHFDGSTQLGISDVILPDLGSFITVEAWINADNLDGGIAEHTIVSNDFSNGGMEEGFALRCGNNGDLSFVIGNGDVWTQVLTTDQPLSTGVWTHVAATYDETELLLHINGVLVATKNTTVSIQNSTDPVRVGKSSLGPRWFEGFLDEIRIWNVVKSADELAMNFCSNYDGSEPDLVAYWKFDDGPLLQSLADSGPNEISINLNNTLPEDWIPDSNCECGDPLDLSASMISQTEALLSWSSLSNLSNIEYGLLGFVLGTGTSIEIGMESNYQLNDLIPNTAYAYYVQDICNPFGTSEWVGPFTFTTLPVCAPPADLSAENISDNAADLVWTSGGSDIWNIQWGPTGFALGAGTMIEGNAANPYSLSGLSPETIYDFYVQDNCLVTESEWIGPFTFTTLDEQCNAPFGLIAENLSDVSASLSWIGGGANSWNIEYGPLGFNPGEGTMVSDITIIPYLLEGLTPETSYAFYVQDVCANSESDWVGPFEFTTLVNGIEENILAEIEIFPNPTKGPVRITLPISNVDHITLDISNALGQVVLSTKLNGGQNSLNLSAFTSGIYFLRFQLNGEWIDYKLILN